MPNLFCPACKATYQDASLVYCLNDGTKLISLGNNSEETVQMSHRTSPMQVNLQNSEPTILANSTASKPAPESRKSSGLLIGVVIIGLLGLLAAAGAVGAYFLLADKSDVVVSSSPTPIPSQTTNPQNANGFDKADILTKELEEKINKLEKQLEAQKQANKAAPSNQTANQSGYATAKVNSPNDGFLALRSAPDVKTGTQLLKIPHGATIVLNNCEKNTVKIDGRSGRWCAVEYDGKSGWVFSAWLDY